MIVRDAVRVLVPATSANLGPAFDCAGLALGLRDELVAMASDDEGVLIEVAGEGSDTVSRDSSHLVAVAMARMFAELGERPAGFVLRCANAIPHGRGLGSSAAAIIGGLVLARAMVEGADIDDASVLRLALELEPHPDNLAAALHGGLTLAWVDEDGGVGVVRRDPHPGLRACAIVPEGRLATSSARAALPATVPLADAARNAGRSALLVHALTTDPDPGLLLAATSDRLHQEQRRSVYPESMALVDRLRDAGIAAFVSGAGPTVLALADEPTVAAVTGALPAGWRLRELPIAAEGAQVAR